MDIHNITCFSKRQKKFLTAMCPPYFIVEPSYVKHLCYLLFSSVFLFQACSADDDLDGTSSSEYYFQFKVDGALIDYEYTPDSQINLTGMYDKDESRGTYAINIAGIKNIFESGTNTLTVFASDTQGISTGVNYSNIPGEGDDIPDLTFSMGYYNSEGNLYIAGGAGDNPLFGLYEPAFVEFSEIADGYISGTFSGTLLFYDSSSGKNILVDSVVVSEGKFKVPRY